MWVVTNGFGAEFKGSQKYYKHTKGVHFGKDFKLINYTGENVTEGAIVKCVESGIVVNVTKSTKSPSGLQIITKHSKGYFRSYQHLSEISVGVGAVLKKGDIIAIAGSTGNTIGPHLHVDRYYRDKEPNEAYILADYGYIKAYYVDPNVNIGDLM